MRYLIFVFFIFSSFNGFSQNEVFYLKDTSNAFSLKDVKNKEFKLIESEIREGYTDATYWFKIPSTKTESRYIFRLAYDRYSNANAFKNSIKLNKLNNQRYLTYLFSRESDVYIKIRPKLHSYFPIEFDTEEKSYLKQKYQLILNCFYYGVAFLIIVYNFFYYVLFKDDAFLYYSLFLGFVCFGIYTMDGMLNFYNINKSIDAVLMVFTYFFMAYFSAKFTNSYLFLDKHYPKLKFFSYFIGILIVIVGVLYLSFKNYYLLLTLNILVFSLLFIYWLIAISLFTKYIYTRILVLAYTLILFSAIDYFILKFLGLSVVDINSTTIKIGAFFEMIILSIAVLYRMKVLKEENEFMKGEIINYSKELLKIKEINTQPIPRNIEKLSVREREVFELVVLGKSNKQIAVDINVSVNTIKFHVKNIYGKLNIKNRKEAKEIENSIK